LTRFLPSVGGVIVVALLTTTGAAQSLVTGRVTGGGRPLAAAEILIEPDSLRTRTNDSGFYRIVLPSPQSWITARAIGFLPASRQLPVREPYLATVNFTLVPLPQVLEPITVEAPPLWERGKMKAFYERRKLGFGRFYTREELAERESSPLSNVLRLTPGLQLFRIDATCGGGQAVATGRQGDARGQGTTCVSPACYATIYLDGMRFWAPGFRREPPPNVDRFKVIDLEGIEVYRSMSEAPIQYTNAIGPSCGVILFWTRVGR
jgi:hypothetical protein